MRGIKAIAIPTVAHCQATPLLYNAAVPLPTSQDLLALLTPQRKYLIGVSGGADSVALLHLLLEAGIRKLVVCHVDHQLRGPASRGDARFVESLCKRHGLTFESTRLPVKSLSAQHGTSLEATARDLRYAFFSQISRSQRCPRLMLAHHADDQAETLLWNLLRGSHGSKGMRSEQVMKIQGRPLHVIRPLLCARREELRHWLQERGETWREDATNAQPIATRNRLRHEALPLLCEIARRDVTPALLRQIEAQKDQEALETWALQQVQSLDPQGRLYVPALQALPDALQNLVLRRYLQDQQIPGISRDLLDRCRALLTDPTIHSVNLPGGRVLRRKAGRITCPPAPVA